MKESYKLFALCYTSEKLTKASHIGEFACAVLKEKVTPKQQEPLYRMYFHKNHIALVHGEVFFAFKNQKLPGVYCKKGNILKIHSYKDGCAAVLIKLTRETNNVSNNEADH